MPTVSYNSGPIKTIKHYVEDSSTPAPVAAEAPAEAAPVGEGTATDLSAAPAAAAPKGPSTPEGRAERAAAWKHAHQVEQRAQRELKIAKQQLSELQKFESLKAMAKDDPTKLAEVLGMSPTEFFRKSQNAMLNIKDEPAPDKKETFEEFKAKYEEKEKKSWEEKIAQQSAAVKTNYVSTKILPVLADKDRYEIITRNGAEGAAQYIYDIMDQHFRATAKNGNDGEELNPEDVADELEAVLLKEYEERILEAKTLKKVKGHFREDTSARSEGLSVPKQLGDDDPLPPTTLEASDVDAPTIPALQQPRLPTKLLTSDSSLSSIERQSTFEANRAARLQKMLKQFDF